MPKKDPWWVEVATSLAAGAVIGAGALAVGVVGASAYEWVQRRDHFHAALRSALAGSGLDLVTAEVGKDAEGAFWKVTVQHPYEGIRVFEVPIEPEWDAHGEEALQRVTDRVGRRFGLGVAR